MVLFRHPSTESKMQESFATQTQKQQEKVASHAPLLYHGISLIIASS
jgi:hypothetical protein